MLRKRIIITFSDFVFGEMFIASFSNAQNETLITEIETSASFFSLVVELKPGFHIVASDGDIPSPTGTWRQCIGDILKSWTDLNFSHFDRDVGDTTGTLATLPKKRSHIIVSVPVASPFHWLRRVPTDWDG